MMPVKHIVLLSLILLSGSSPLIAQKAGDTQAPKFAPPWLVQSGNFMMVAFNLKADDVTKLLPKGVEPLVNKEGMVTALLEMYETSKVSGISDYKTAFIVVDVKGHDSREGTPGHFAVWGRVSPQEALDAFKSNFGFPYKSAENIRLGLEQDGQVGAIGAPGKEILRMKITPIPEQPFTGQGSVNMVGMNADSGPVKAEVPYISRGYFGKVVNFEVRTKGEPVLKLIKDAAPVWSLVSKDQIFSYSHAVFSD